MLLENDRVIERRKQLAAVSVGVIAIFVVLPLWWKTTEVYRASLPYSEIEQLSIQQDVITVTRHVTVVALLESQPAVDVLFTRLQEFLTSKEKVVKNNKYVSLRYIVRKVTEASTVNAVEEKLIASEDIREASDAISTLLALNYTGHFTLVVYPRTVNPSLFSAVQAQAFVARQRLALLQLPSSMETDHMLPVIADTLETVYGGVNLQKVLSESLHTHDQDVMDAERMRQLRPSTGIQLSFTLVNANPSALHTQWNIEQAVNGLLRPFLDHCGINSLGSFSIESQLLYYADLKLGPTKRDGLYKVSANKLPQSLSVLESRLGFQVSQLPSLSFVIYVPPLDKSPLFFYYPPDWEHGFTSFLSPQWGGLVVYNHNLTATDDRLPVDVFRVMPTFITQLKKLLGLPDLERHSDIIQLDRLKSHELYDWQVDRLLEAKMIECIASTSATLHSLLQLLDEVKNMVISDDIQQEVEQSLKALIKSKEYSKDGVLDLAFQSAKESMQSAEKAFFDPSILELLYFPDDQKFAIYIPLFVPVGIPVLLSLVAVLRQFVHKKDHRKQE